MEKKGLWARGHYYMRKSTLVRLTIDSKSWLRALPISIGCDGPDNGARHKLRNVDFNDLAAAECTYHRSTVGAWWGREGSGVLVSLIVLVLARVPVFVRERVITSRADERDAHNATRRSRRIGVLFTYLVGQLHYFPSALEIFNRVLSSASRVN